MSATKPNQTLYVRTTESERVVIRDLPAPGPPGPPGDLPITLEIELTLSRFYPNSHKEIIYSITDPDGDSDVVQSINTYDSPAKAVLIFTKVFFYGLTGKIETIVSTYVPTGDKIVKNITRDSITGRFISVDRMYTA